MNNKKVFEKIYLVVIGLGVFTATFLTNNCNAQVATITVNNANMNVMTNTKLLFGITFDSRTSLMGNTSIGLIGYYDSSGVVIPQVDSIFNDFPMSTLRYPGNGISVGFNWQKSIGPVNLRPNQDLMGTQGAPQPVKFGFDEFMAMTAAKGVPSSEIQIMVPIYDSAAVGLNLTQSRASVPNVISHNADWVEYCNAPNDSNISNPGGGIDWAEIRAANGHPAPYGIKIWNIGNEPWSTSEYGGTAAGCNNYLAIATPIIDAMLAIDSTIKITMPTNGNPTPGIWSHALINSTLAQQGKIYSLSQHFFGDENPSTLSPSILALNTQITSLVTAAALKNIKVFIGDYAHRIPDNPSSAQKDSAMQWLGANLEADFLVLLSQKATIERANFWVYGNATATWHPIRKNSTGNYTLLPAAEIYKILFPAFLDNSVQVTTTSPLASDGIPGSYSIRSNAFISNNMNHLNIIAVNRDKINTVPFHVSGITGYTLTNNRVLNATINTSETIIQSAPTIDALGNYLMPPMSVLILEYTNLATLLPIELLSFTGKASADKNILYWTTANEFQNDYFTILKSTNGNNFNSMATVNGAGNSAQTLNYSIEDEHPLGKINYYILQQTDYNGNNSFSKAIAINNSSDKINLIIISPNPATDFIQISFLQSECDYEIEIINTLGELMIKKQNEYRIDVSSLPNGIYYIKVTENHNSHSQKFIKQ